MDPNKSSSLLESLTGSTTLQRDVSSSSPDQDLFGDIPIDDDRPTATTTAAFLTAPIASQIPALTNLGAAIPAPPPLPPPPPPTAGLDPLAMLTAPSMNGAGSSESNSDHYSDPVTVSQPPAASTSPPPKSLLAKSGLLGMATGGDPTSSDGNSGGGGGGLFDDLEREEAEAERQEAEAAAKAAAEAQRREAELLAQRQLEAQQQQLLMQQQQQALMQQQQQNQQQMYMMQQQHQQQMQQQQQKQQQQQQMQQQQQYQYPSMIQSQPHLVGPMQDMSFSTPPRTLPPPQQPSSITSGFYREHSSPQRMIPGTSNSMLLSSSQPAVMPSYGGESYYYSTTGGPVQTHTFAQATHQQQPMINNNMNTTSPAYRGRYQQPGSITAGMHNGPPVGVLSGVLGKPPQARQIVKPEVVQPVYGNVKISDALLIQSAAILGVVTTPPHWTYQVTTELLDSGSNDSTTTNSYNGAPAANLCWFVRRRFRHVVALEDRLRQDCPGAILPPRPDKHATRALEEASAQQSAEFAKQRATELEVYLNQLVKHPIAGTSSVLRLFLALQDDLGTAWPEVSSNAFTRLTAASTGVAVKVAENTSGTKGLPWDSAGSEAAMEDNAELLALASSEGLRMGAVAQAVPKLEGAVTLIKEHGEIAGAAGMELSRLCKEVEASDRELGLPFEILSNGLLRFGRRTKRLSIELSAALQPFVLQYKMCRNEKLAFADRRQALARRHKERSKADTRAQQLMIHQRSLQAHGQLGHLDRLERDASLYDEVAVDAVRECDQIGETLKREVNRVAYERRMEWSKSIKVICSAMKEASAERAAIWESTKESFLQTFPDMNESSGGAAS